MDPKKICFILCSNDEFLAEECEHYIWQLHVPEGYHVDVLVVQGAQSMCGGYNEAMAASDAKYKVYLHQDVLIIHKDFICEMLRLFREDPAVGMIGMVGNTSLAEDGGAWSDGMHRRIGEVYIDVLYTKSKSVFAKIRGRYEEALVLDGLLMATQYDIPWREDLFQGWDFYDCSQSIEFWRAGYKVVVPHMDEPWCLHDNDILNMKQYDRWRRVFVEEYGDFLNEWNEKHIRQERGDRSPQNPDNYGLYFMLGDYYSESNVDQAYLCYEHALFYCDSGKDRELIRQRMEKMRGCPRFHVAPVSVVIASRDRKDYLQQCLDSVRQTSGENGCEIVVVDCGAGGETPDWLRGGDGIRLIRGTAEMGYTAARNLGIREAAPQHDILLLDSDTVLLPHSLFWLRMGLYERETVGAAGPLTNQDLNGQKAPGEYRSPEEYVRLSEQFTGPEKFPYENKIWLSNFALLIKREALERVGLFETGYEGGMAADTDYGMRLTEAGFELLLCYNSSVIYYGAGDFFQGNEQYTLYMEENRKKLCDKWGFNPFYYFNPREILIAQFDQSTGTPVRVLEVGCGMGANLARIRRHFPEADVYGIELVERVAAFGTYLADITCGDIETMQIPYKHYSFDYIIFGDVLEHLRDPEKVLVKMKEYLKPDGKVIASIPNLMNISVIAPLLRGYFTYRSEGLLDRTHIHFFTQHEIVEMFKRCGYELVTMGGAREREPMAPEDEKIAEALYSLPGIAEREQFEIYQYVVTARPL